ncbi:MAG: hypothetical protein V1720_09960 [bacterium]
MRKILNTTFLLLLMIAALACSKEETTDPITESAIDYYPGNLTSSFTYSTDTLSSTGGNAANVGSRVSTFDRNETINGIQYIIQKNASTVGGVPFNSEVGFRRTDTEINFAIDTAGIGGMIDSVAAALGFQLDINIDSEIKVFSFPLFAGKTWDAFKLSVGLIGMSINIIEVKSEYQGQESISVLGGTSLAEKIKYTATVRMPTSVEDIVNPPTEIFTANGWFVKDVGLAKIEGSAIILQAISIGEIDLENTRVVRETLTQYTIK